MSLNPLARMLQDQDRRVRIVTACALEMYGDPRGTEVLTQEINDQR